jgi:ribosomal protein S18 acetylase RimI-like enzyme
MIINYIENSSESKEIKEITNLYEASFPEIERRDKEEFERFLSGDKKAFNVTSVRVDGAFAGFLSHWEWGETAYLEHFAILPTKRGNGIGTQLFNHLLAVSPAKRIILEVEPVIDDLTLARVRFYEKRGFTLHTKYDYVQPAYRPGGQPLKLNLMTYGPFSDVQIKETIARMRREVYGLEN